jgi:hypothetical protein
MCYLHVPTMFEEQRIRNTANEKQNNNKNDKTNIKISHIQIMFHADNSMFILFSHSDP